MTLDNWDALHLNGTPAIEKTLNLLQVDHRDRGIDMLHVWGITGFLESYTTKGCLIILSIFAATAYVCQYAIIKGVGSFSES